MRSPTILEKNCSRSWSSGKRHRAKIQPALVREPQAELIGNHIIAGCGMDFKFHGVPPQIDFFVLALPLLDKRDQVSLLTTRILNMPNNACRNICKQNQYAEHPDKLQSFLLSITNSSFLHKPHSKRCSSLARLMFNRMCSLISVLLLAYMGNSTSTYNP